MSLSSLPSSLSCQVIITSALDLTHLIMDCLLQSEKGFPKTMKIISELKYLPDLLALYEEIGRERTGLLETMKELKRENDAKAQKIEDLE